ncbi:MAG: S8 family peptidase [Terricaulis sp.]
MGALRKSHLALQVLVLAMLGACASGGGGGGGGSPLPPPPPPMSPPAPRPTPMVVPPLPPLAAPGSFPSAGSTEFQNNWGPGGIGVQSAWQFENGHGEGVLVGVIDDGVDPSHPELAGRIDPASIDIVASRNTLTSSLSHGSELSSIIAGNFNGAQTVGVAYEATILAVRADSGGGFEYQDLANAVNYAVAHDVDVINFSLGSSSLSGSPGEVAFRNALADATAAGVIIVSSAGNDGGFASDPNYPGNWATNAGISNGLFVIAGASNPDGSFNARSNPAGAAAQSYLVAPGWQIIVPDLGPVGPVAGYQECYPNPASCTGLVKIQGTSYSAPTTAGAVAILMSAFPGLTPHQVVTLLLQTTDDMGPTGIDKQTGWGRLNLARAFAPVGTLSIPLADGMASSNPSMMLGAVGPAFGDGLSDDVGEWQTVGFDRFERTYKVDLGNNWARAHGGPGLGVRAPTLWRTERGEMGAAMQFAPAEDIAPDSYRLPVPREDLQQAAVRIDSVIAPGLSLSFAANGAQTRTGEMSEPGGHMGFVNADTSLRLTQRLTDHVGLSFLSESGEGRVGLMQERAERTATAAQATFDFGRFGFDATFGEIEEQQGLLGLVWSDALGNTPRGETRFASFAGHFDPAADWRVSFQGETGVADLAQAGWLTIGEPLRTSAFTAELLYFGAPDFGAPGRGMLTLTVSQPMRVEDGVLLARLPNATAYGRRSMKYETRAIDPTPSGRELRLGLGYRYFESDRISAFGEALYVTQPGHVADAADDAVLRVGLRVRR